MGTSEGRGISRIGVGDSERVCELVDITAGVSIRAGEDVALALSGKWVFATILDVLGGSGIELRGCEGPIVTRRRNTEDQSIRVLSLE